MRKLYILINLLLFSTMTFAQLIEQKILPIPALNVQFSGNEVCVNQNYAFVSSNPFTDFVGGQVRIYNIQNGTWVQTGVLQQDATCNTSSTWNLQFGESLASYGDWLIVGASAWDSDCLGNIGPDGVVFIYKRDGVNWNYHSRLSDPNIQVGEEFGKEVSIQGNWLIVGAPGKQVNGNSGSGSVFVYSYNSINDSWDFSQMIDSPNALQNDKFGASLEVDGNNLVVSAYNKTLGGNLRAGIVYLYELNGAVWNNIQDFTVDGTPRNSYFGQKVALSGDYVFISFTDINDGSLKKVRVLKNTAGVWVEQTDLFQLFGESFGNDIAISGNYAVISDYNVWDQGKNTGIAHLYNLIADQWEFVETIRSSDGVNSDEFGYSVGIDNSHIIVGARYHDVPNLSSGAAYIYSLQEKLAEINAAFSFDPMVAPAGATITFTDKSLASNTEIISWSWDFDGDGFEDSNEQNPTHQFVIGANYPITLTISNGNIESTITRWATALPASANSCVPYIPFSGTEQNNQGIAAWNTNGFGNEPFNVGHSLVQPPASIQVAYYYLASRDYDNIDSNALSGLSANGFASNFPNLTTALQTHNKSIEDLSISFGLTSLGDDFNGVDWQLIGDVEWRKYTGGNFYIKLDNENMITGVMPTLDLNIDYNAYIGGTDVLSGETTFAMPIDDSQGSSASTQAIASAFLADCENASIKFLFSSINSANQMEFAANGRNGGFFDVDQGYIIRECNENSLSNINLTFSKGPSVYVSNNQFVMDANDEYILSYIIYDNLGRIVEHQESIKTNKVYSITIKNTGLYFVNIITSSGDNNTYKRIVK